MSRLDWWLNINTAGRSDHRFCSPVTFSVTPPRASAMSLPAPAPTFAPACRLWLSRPTPAPSHTEVPRAVSAQPVRRAGTSAKPRRGGSSRTIGQPRVCATSTSPGSGFSGRGWPTAFSSGTSSVPLL